MLLQEINEQLYALIKELEARGFQFCAGTLTEAYRQFMLELEIRSGKIGSTKGLQRKNRQKS